jgi:hypothetical protein
LQLALQSGAVAVVKAAAAVSCDGCRRGAVEAVAAVVEVAVVTVAIMAVEAVAVEAVEAVAVAVVVRRGGRERRQ